MTLPNVLQQLLDVRDFLFDPARWPALKAAAMFISLVLSTGLVVAIVWVFKKNWALEIRPMMPKKSSAAPMEKIAKKLWDSILKKMERGTIQDLAFAIIEADKLVDTVLKDGGFPGDTMAERLKRIDKHQLASIDNLWGAHKIRNDIVHTPGFQLELETAKSVLADYQKTLEELEVI